MFGWFTPSSCSDALERKIAAVRAALAEAERRLADDAAARAEKDAITARAVRDLDLLTDRVSRMEEIQRDAEVTIADAIERLTRLEQPPEPDPRIDRLEMTLLRLDHQLAAHSEEMRTFARGVLERVKLPRGHPAE